MLEESLQEVAETTRLQIQLFRTPNDRIGNASIPASLHRFQNEDVAVAVVLDRDQAIQCVDNLLRGPGVCQDNELAMYVRSLPFVVVHRIGEDARSPPFPVEPELEKPDLQD
jgi:hypothetical protein